MVLDPDWFSEVAAQPANPSSDLQHPAISETDLTNHGYLRAVDEPPEHLALKGRGKDRNVGGLIKRAQQTHDGIHKVVRQITDGYAGLIVAKRSRAA